MGQSIVENKLNYLSVLFWFFFLFFFPPQEIEVHKNAQYCVKLFIFMLFRCCEDRHAVEIFLLLSELSQKLTSIESTIICNTHNKHPPDNYWSKVIQCS